MRAATTEEALFLNQTQSYETLVTLPAWEEILAFLDQLHADAVNSQAESMSTAHHVLLAEKIRVAERNRLRTFLRNFVQAKLDDRKAMLESMAETEEEYV